MQIKNEKPPIWDEAMKMFNLPEDQITFFTYGDMIYNPAGVAISADLIRHEETHAEQQEHNTVVANIWWQRYLVDAEFRANQEAEAYGAQYKFICASVKDKNRQSKILVELARHLSSAMYGNCITHSEAMKRIKEYASGKDIEKIEDLLKDDKIEL